MRNIMYVKIAFHNHPQHLGNKIMKKEMINIFFPPTKRAAIISNPNPMNQVIFSKNDPPQG